MVRLLTWNIQHGGGARRTPWIALALVESGADVIVLTEFRPGRGGQIRAALADHGLKYHAITAGGPTDNCVLIASREPLVSAASEPGAPESRRWLEVWLSESRLRLAGAHIPPGPGAERTFVWRRLLEAAARWADEPVALLGDFNCGRTGADGRWFRHTALLGRLATLGYTDAWRAMWPDERAVTWRGPDGAAGRIDHCFLGPRLAGRLVGAWIDQSRARWDGDAGDFGLSDHAPLLVELAPAAHDSALPTACAGPPNGKKTAKNRPDQPD